MSKKIVKKARRLPRFETLRAKVGATLLDVFRPGWADEIDVGRLNLRSCDACVLGQLFGDYRNGAEKLFAVVKEARQDVETAAVTAGFQTWDQDLAVYSNLTKAWKREIAKRVTA